MSTPEYIAWLLLGLLSLAGSWLCSGMETGTYTLNRIRLMVRAEGRGEDSAAAQPTTSTRAVGDAAARLLRREVDNPERLLGTILIGNNIFAYLAAISITELLTGHGYSDTQILLLNILILTPLILVFCEALPKELFRLEADRLSYIFAPAIAFFRIVFTITLALPLVLLIARLTAKLVGVEGELGLAVSARERVAILLKETVSEGALSPAQAKLVDRAIAFHRLTISDEMVPWSRAATVRADWDRPRLLRHFAQHPYSRFPVVEFGRSAAPAPGAGGSGGVAASSPASPASPAPPSPADRGSPMRVVGILRQSDVYLRPSASIRELMVEPARLGPEASLRDALAILRDRLSEMIIIERAGRPVGIATVKDIAEPLTGVVER